MYNTFSILQFETTYDKRYNQHVRISKSASRVRRGVSHALISVLTAALLKLTACPAKLYAKWGENFLYAFIFAYERYVYCAFVVTTRLVNQKLLPRMHNKHGKGGKHMDWTVLVATLAIGAAGVAWFVPVLQKHLGLIVGIALLSLALVAGLKH